MSLRQIARQLGVSHTLLVLWRQGKRSLPAEVELHYYRLVTSGYNPKGAGAPEVPRKQSKGWWASLDSNQGPQSYQDCALTG